jgi:hypothetical protein
VTNVPGPQFPHYLLGRRLSDVFPMVPLASGQALGVAIMSYDGGINFGLVGDFDALPDLDELAADFVASLAELAELAGVKLEGSGARTGPPRRPAETAVGAVDGSP